MHTHLYIRLLKNKLVKYDKTNSSLSQKRKFEMTNLQGQLLAKARDDNFSRLYRGKFLGRGRFCLSPPRTPFPAPIHPELYYFKGKLPPRDFRFIHKVPLTFEKL